MYKIRTTFTFEASHQLNLTYDSPCKNLHGHSYICSATIVANSLDQNGMICDFKVLKAIIKQKIEDRLDHHHLNDVFGKINSTAEYMSKWICEQINEGLRKQSIYARCCKIELNETAKNQAIWEE